MNPQEAERQYKKALSLHGRGEWKQAEAIYHKLHKAFPQLDSVLTNLGGVLYQQGRFESALRYLDKALALNPLGADAVVNRAAVLTALGRTGDAEEAYQKVVALQPENAQAHYNLANFCYQKGDVEAAKAGFLQAIRIDPSLVPAQFNLGHLYLELQEVEQAEAQFRKVLALDPGFVKAYVNLGNLQAERGENKEAQANYELALEVDPESTVAMLALGRLLQDMGFAEEAMELVEDVLERNGDDPVAWILKGNAANSMREYRQARVAYERALALEPGNVHAERNLRRLLGKRIPSWHIPMLADHGRNQAYDKALTKALAQGGRVLDIGTGSGLLAMMAARAGAESVVACEGLKGLAQAAKDIVAANGLSDKVRVLHRHSTSLDPEKDLGGKVDVVVSEVLGIALLDEGVLPTHRHAVRELLKPGGKVIPGRAEVFAQLVSLPDRRGVVPIGEVEGFDLREMRRFQDLSEAQGMELGRERWEPISGVQPLWEVDFLQLPLVAPEERAEEWKVDFPVENAGSVHALALWFDLWLDEEIVVSSKPGGALRHWGQAVFFFEEDRQVQAGEVVSVAVSRSEFGWRFEW